MERNSEKIIAYWIFGDYGLEGRYVRRDNALQYARKRSALFGIETRVFANNCALVAVYRNGVKVGA